MTVMLTFLINFYKTANRMENGNLEEGFYFPYLRHIFGLWWKLQKQKHLWCHQPQHMANMAAVSLLMCHRGSLILSLSWAHGHCICVCMQCNCIVCQKCTWSIPTQERFIAKYYSYYYICSCSKTVTHSVSVHWGLYSTICLWSWIGIFPVFLSITPQTSYIVITQTFQKKTDTTRSLQWRHTPCCFMVQW